MNAFYSHLVGYFLSYIAVSGSGTSLYQLNQGGCWPTATKPP